MLQNSNSNAYAMCGLSTKPENDLQRTDKMSRIVYIVESHKYNDTVSKKFQYSLKERDFGAVIAEIL